MEPVGTRVLERLKSSLKYCQFTKFRIRLYRNIRMSTKVPYSRICHHLNRVISLEFSEANLIRETENSLKANISNYYSSTLHQYFCICFKKIVMISFREIERLRSVNDVSSENKKMTNTNLNVVRAAIDKTRIINITFKTIFLIYYTNSCL